MRYALIMSLPESTIFSVSQFVAAVSAYLEQGLATVVVQGEVTGFRVNRERLVYFELKDPKARVLCFMMRWDLKVPLEDGMEIKVTGSPKLFQASGQFHLRVMAVELVGAGALQRAYALLKTKLESEGLFAPGRKRPLPRFPEHIGVVTSEDAAAWTDVQRVLKNRWPLARITLAHVGVQGASAIPEIVGAIRWFNVSVQRPDVLIVTRGGGSLEDLQAFNSEDVVRAIFGSVIPVVVGVGHERDVTLADFVADVRAATPSNAAELAVPDARAVARDVAVFTQHCDTALARAITTRVHAVATHVRVLDDHVRAFLDAPTRLLARFSDSFAQFRTRLAVLRERIVRTTSLLDVRLVGRIREYTDALVGRTRLLTTLSPQATLERGYSITFSGKKVVRRIADAPTGTELTTRLADGSIASVVEKRV